MDVPRHACVIAMVVVVAACGASPSSNGPLTNPVDAGAGAGDDASAGDDAAKPPGDAGIDADPGPGPGPIDGGVPSDLVAICGEEPVTFDDWEDCYLKRWCQWQVECVPLNTYRDVAECIASGDAVLGGQLTAERRERKRAVDAGRASINVANFTRCLLDTGEARCNTTQSNVSCATRFTGTIHDSAICFNDIECASPGADCTSACTDACCTGTCSPKFKEGQACTDIRSCEPGLQCHRTCIAGDINTPCASDRDCDPNAWCDIAAKLCRADLAPGAACTNPLQCGGETSCVGTNVTTTNPGHCLRISRPDDTCDAFCYGNLYCNGSTCTALPVLGHSCTALIPCAGVDVICDVDTCVRKVDVGVACGAQTCLPGLFCTSAINDPNPTCAPRRAEGEPCADPSQCESYLCSGNNVQSSVCLAWSNTCPASGI